MAKKRIYVVEVKGNDPRLVRASTAAQARGHVTRDTVEVRVASQDDLIELRTVDPEDAGED